MCATTFVPFKHPLPLNRRSLAVIIYSERSAWTSTDWLWFRQNKLVCVLPVTLWESEMPENALFLMDLLGCWCICAAVGQQEIKVT